MSEQENEEDWGQVHITVPVNTVVVASVAATLNEEAEWTVHCGLHVPDPQMTRVAEAAVPSLLRRMADEYDQRFSTADKEETT